jgi:hypothetical protein
MSFIIILDIDRFKNNKINTIKHLSMYIVYFIINIGK